MENILSRSDVDAFKELGFCKLSGAFSEQHADAAAECLWRRMEVKAGIRKSDPCTWPTHYDIQEPLKDPQVVICFSDRLANAIEQLTGPGRWRGDRRWGFWPVNFSFGSNRPYEIPNSGWHIDGNWFRHKLDSPHQGLLVIGLFTDIVARGGGTILSLGSHKLTAQVLAQHPEGLYHRDLFNHVLRSPIDNFYEITGRAGDVFLVHPFLFHTRGYKHVGKPRIISNTEAGLSQPMKLHRPWTDDYSILEESIILALNCKRAKERDAKLCTFC